MKFTRVDITVCYETVLESLLRQIKEDRSRCYIVSRFNHNIKDDRCQERIGLRMYRTKMQSLHKPATVLYLAYLFDSINKFVDAGQSADFSIPSNIALASKVMGRID